MRWRRPVPIVLLAIALATPASADLVERAPLESAGAVRVELDRGEVEVLTHPDRDVRVEARARGVGASSIHFQLAERNGELVLTGSAEPWVDWLRRGPRVSVRIWVPESCGVTVVTSGGDVRVEGVVGHVVAHGRDGTIRVSQVDGPVEVRSSGGSIWTRSVRGPVSVAATGDATDLGSP